MTPRTVCPNKSVHNTFWGKILFKKLIYKNCSCNDGLLQKCLLRAQCTFLKCFQSHPLVTSSKSFIQIDEKLCPFRFFLWRWRVKYLLALWDVSQMQHELDIFLVKKSRISFETSNNFHLSSRCSSRFLGIWEQINFVIKFLVIRRINILAS